MEIKLTNSERLEAYGEAVKRMQAAMARNATHSRGLMIGFNDDFHMNVNGAMAEVAVAKALGVEYDGGKPYEPDDVAGCEVKQTHYPKGHLLIPPYNPNSHRSQIPDETPVVLVIGDHMKRREGFRVAGWIGAGEGRKIGSLGPWGNPNRPKIYGVNQRQLSGIETLREKIGG